MTTFSKNLRKLREDSKISQKAAAATLGISQALLSHYEKGIRECGLDFLARAAKYYGVTTDYMLGLSAEKPDLDASCCSGCSSCSERPDYPNEENLTNIKDIKKDGSTYSVSILYKNLIIHALNYIFGGMRDLKNRDTAIISGKYLLLSIYRLCGVLYSGLETPENLCERFTISELECILKLEDLDAPLGQYNFDNPYLNNIIKNAELE